MTRSANFRSFLAFNWNRLLAKLYIPMTYRHWHNYNVNPCPHCGGEAVSLRVELNGNPRRAISCRNCHLMSPVVMTDREAVYAWNHLRRIEREEGEE
ncbi:MAG: Lar family restriction alleviation protein [Mailhella sp.]|nr:Lar family restriction alleviation protein [Mailhella sp.]